MLRRYTPKLIEKIIASAATPEFLAPNDGTRLYGLMMIGEKALGVENAGNITIRIQGVDAIILEPGERLTWPMPSYDPGYYLPEDFILKAAVDGDGVRCITHQLMGA